MLQPRAPTLRRTNSAAISASLRPSAQRYSIARFRPSLQPSSRSRCTNAAANWPWVAGVAAPKYPMVGGFADCCARAASGQAIAAPPIDLMKSRRLTRPSRRFRTKPDSDIRQIYSITSSTVASSCAGTSRPSALAVCMLMTNSNLVDCTTGRSAGFAPLRILPV